MSRAKVSFWLFRTKKANGGFHPRWRIRYVGPDGKAKYATGFPDKGETRRLAQQLALEADEIRRGVRKAPEAADTESLRPVPEHVDAYLAWGRMQGGHGGRPWSEVHQKTQESNLKWWVETLKLGTLREISLSAVEKALQEKAAKDGVTGKTLSNISMTLRGFVTWCVERKALAADPLRGLRDFDTSVTPENFRRALALDEVGRLLAATPEPRRMLYRLALVSGFRSNELRSLRVGDLDAVKRTFTLRAACAKDRREAVAALPADLVEGLAALVAGRALEEPIFPDHNQAHAARLLGLDLDAAGIPRRTFGGKVDFHSLRTTHVNLGIELGFDVKTAQTLARHKTPDLTMNVYGRAKADRLRAAVETLDGAIADAVCSRNSRKEVKREPLALAAGAETSRNSLARKDVSPGKNGEGDGSRGASARYYSVTFEYKEVAE